MKTAADPELGHVAELSSSVALLDSQIAEQRAARAELASRRSALQAQIERRAEVHPGEDVDGEAALVDALAANPSRSPNQDEVAALIEQKALSHQVLERWEAHGVVLQKAIANLDGEIANDDAAIARMVRARRVEWGKFVVSAHAVLAARFRQALRDLREDVLTPMLALQGLKNDDRNPIVPASALRICRLSQVTMDSYGNRAEHGERLLHAGDFHAGGEQLDVIKRFRATLTSEG